MKFLGSVRKRPKTFNSLYEILARGGTGTTPGGLIFQFSL